MSVGTLDLESMLFSPPEAIWEQATLFLESPMGTGKTKQIIKHITGTIKMSTIIITFRRTLVDDLMEMLPHFTDYRTIKGPIINVTNLIIQVDSIWRVRRIFERMVVDECSSTMGRVASNGIGSATTTKEAYRFVNSFMTNTTRSVIFADADINSTVLRTYFKNTSNRTPLLVRNSSNIHENKRLRRIETFVEFIQELIDSLRGGEKVFLPSNSKNEIEVIETIVNKVVRDLRWKIITADTENMIEGSITSDWDQYDIVAISPKIIAGISFELPHFNRVMAIFTPMSCRAALCMQMLMRVRDVEYISLFVKRVEFGEESFPTDEKSVERAIENRCRQCRIEEIGLIEFNHASGTVVKDNFYWMNVEITKEINRSKMNFEGELFGMLEKQGFILENPRQSPGPSAIGREKKQKRENFQGDRRQVQEAKDLLLIGKETPCITEVEYQVIKTSSNATSEERRACEKYRYKKTFGQFPPDDLTIYRKYKKVMKQFKILRSILELPRRIVETNLTRDVENLANTIRSADCSSDQLFNDNKSVKTAHCLNLIHIAGLSLYTNLTEINVAVFNFEGLRQYYLKNHISLDGSFGTRSKKSWTKTLSAKGSRWKAPLLLSINKRLKSYIGCNIQKSSKHGKDSFYFLNGLELWDWRGYRPRKRMDGKWLSLDQGEDQTIIALYRVCDGLVKFYDLPDQPCSHPSYESDEEDQPEVFLYEEVSESEEEDEEWGIGYYNS